VSGLGTDLRVVLGPPGMIAHDTSPLDVRVAPRLAPTGGEAIDLATIDGRHNLGQALILRMLTPRGALAELGHAEYGSRLGELIGQRKTDTARALCKTFVLEVLAQEPRVDNAAVEFAFDVASEGPSELRFTVAVRPVTGDDIVAIDLAVGL
jgi:phage baseplate assembly protein W